MTFCRCEAEVQNTLNNLISEGRWSGHAEQPNLWMQMMVMVRWSEHAEQPNLWMQMMVMVMMTVSLLLI
jgi:hypothetical protein